MGSSSTEAFPQMQVHLIFYPFYHNFLCMYVCIYVCGSVQYTCFCMRAYIHVHHIRMCMALNMLLVP